MFSINNKTNKNNNSLKEEMKLKQSLIQSRNAIRKKYQDLQSTKQTISRKFSELYKPLIEPIKKISDTKGKNEKTEKVEKTEHIFAETPLLKSSELKFDSVPDSVFKTAIPGFRRNLFANKPKLPSSEQRTQHFSQHDISGISELDTSMNAGANASTSTEPSTSQDLNITSRIGELTKEITIPSQDHIYGLRTHHGDLYMGKSPVSMKKVNNQFKYCVKNREFPATPGLTDLLLLSNPKYYTDKDLSIYKEMLMTTDAHKENYNASTNIRRIDSSIKYNKIIASLFPKRRKSIHHKTVSKGTKGEGYIDWWQQLKKPQTAYKTFDKSGAINYTYWDDPNELVDRLRLLVASKAAGHTGHNNEIISIIEELREAKYIM